MGYAASINKGMLEWIMMGGGGMLENANLRVWTTVG